MFGLFATLSRFSSNHFSNMPLNHKSKYLDQLDRHALQYASILILLLKQLTTSYSLLPQRINLRYLRTIQQKNNSSKSVPSMNKSSQYWHKTRIWTQHREIKTDNELLPDKFKLESFYNINQSYSLGLWKNSWTLHSIQSPKNKTLGRLLCLVSYLQIAVLDLLSSQGVSYL